ncbi:MAG: glycine zipper domain-containing protein [Candidatus Binataceae bacterium]
MDARKIAASASGKQRSIQPKGRKIWRYCAGTFALVAMLSLAGCYGAPLSTREKGTLIGGAVGLGGGALVGSAVGSPAAGAAIGGLVGAGGGYLIGNHMQNERYGYGDYGWRGGRGGY